MAKIIRYKKIFIQRGLCDKVEIGTAKIIETRSGSTYFGTTSIVEIIISEPFKGLIRIKNDT